MSLPLPDYANIPEARRIVRMYLADARVADIVRAIGFCEDKIRTVLKACGVTLRPAGRAGLSRKEPLKPLPPEITPEWHASRGTCWHCGIRRDIGCRHHPVGDRHALEVAQGDACFSSIMAVVNPDFLKTS